MDQTRYSDSALDGNSKTASYSESDRFVASTLLALPHPSIRVSSRNPAKKANFTSTVKVVQGDLSDPSTYPSLFNGVDRMFLYVQRSILATQVVSAAKAGGVQRVVLLSSVSIDYDPEGMLAKLHRDVENPIKASGMEYTFLRPGMFASNARVQWIPQILDTGKVAVP